MAKLIAERLAPQTPARWADIPETIHARLAREGVTSVADWLALGKRRFRVWGVTRSMVRELDALARGAA
jgi:hypothetical protein